MTIQWLRHSIRRFARLIVILSESEGSILIILCKAKAEDPKIIIKKEYYYGRYLRSYSFLQK